MSRYSILYFLSSILVLAPGCGQNQPPAQQGPSSVLVAARRALDAGQGGEAIADAGSYLMSQPNGPEAAEAYYLQGRGYEQTHASDSSEARRNLDQARSAYMLALQHHPSPDLEGNVHASLSNVAFFEDDFATAIEQASAAMNLLDSSKTKSFLLYRIGLSQQRLSRFNDADLTFNQVVQRYPGTPIADAARQHVGQRAFFVQLATYPSAAAADKDADRVRSAGIVSRRTNSQGLTIIDEGPFPTFVDAKNAKDQVIRQFPDAVIVP